MLPSASSTRTPPVTSSGPFDEARTRVSVGRADLCARRRRVRSAPDGQSATAASISSAVAASTATHGRRVSSKTCGSDRTQFREWKQRRGSHSTTISSVAYSRLRLSRVVPALVSLIPISLDGSCPERPRECYSGPVQPQSRTDRIVERIRAIPEGWVRTYGDIDPRAPRLVGLVLSRSRGLPWQRVVRADGSLAMGARQRQLLLREGVPMRGDRVDMDEARLPQELQCRFVTQRGQ